MNCEVLFADQQRFVTNAGNWHHACILALREYLEELEVGNPPKLGRFHVYCPETGESEDIPGQEVFTILILSMYECTPEEEARLAARDKEYHDNLIPELVCV